MALGVEILTISISNANAGDVTLFPMAKESAKIDLGGLVTEDKKEGITASGEGVWSLSRKRAEVECPPIAWSRSGGADVLESVFKIANDFNESSFTFTATDGTVYAGKGRIVGDVTLDTLQANFPLKIQFSGQRLSKI